MKIQRRLISSLICALAILANLAFAGVGASQEKTAQPRHDILIQHDPVMIAGAPGQEFERPLPHGIFGHGGDTFMFISSEMSLDKTVKGAPYSAQVVTEHAQTLADGNRILHKTTASVYRDSEGRIRRDQTINAVGAYTAAGNPPQTFFINDPVAGVNYILEPDTKTARKVDLSKLGLPRGPRRMRERRVEVVTGDKAKEGAQVSITVAGPAARAEADSKNFKKESLGKQTIEGVAAEGTRHTRTIPSGEIGNEQPINIVSESWYSADLQTVVMSKHSDPRFGESNYRLTNINRSEPAASLFQVPSDYSIKETVPPDMRIKIDREIRRHKDEQ